MDNTTREAIKLFDRWHITDAIKDWAAIAEYMLALAERDHATFEAVTRVLDARAKALGGGRVTTMPKCALCKRKLTVYANTLSIYARNPKTFRMAWMHDVCAIQELDALHGQPSRDPQYDDRYEEYILRFEGSDNP